MFALERQKHILEVLREEGSVSVNRLSKALSVTEETIRRDLEKLEKEDALMRTHGGAIPMDNQEMPLEKRKQTNTAIKEKLARAAVKFILPGDTVFLDASTTTFFIARELKKMKKVTVVTNSLRILNELADVPDIKVISIGGLVSRNQSLVGSQAVNCIKENYYVNKMFFSSRGISINAGILESNEQECAIKQCMVANAKSKFYMFDRSKVGRIGLAKLAKFEEINHVIAEKNFSEELHEKFNEYNIEIHEI